MKQTSLKPWHESYEAEAWVICAPLIARSQSTPESLSLMMFFSDSVTDDSICSEPRFSTGIKENYHFVPSENSYQKGSRSDYHAETLLTRSNVESCLFTTPSPGGYVQYQINYTCSKHSSQCSVKFKDLR